MIRKRRQFTTKLGMERLEDRLALTGNVTAEVIDRTLFVTGDQEANYVYLETTGDQASVLGAADTKINGSHEQVVLNEFDNVVVNLRGGNDTLSSFYIVANGNMELDGGEGQDNVAFQTFSMVNISGNLTIRNFERVNVVGPEQFFVGGNLDISAHRESAEGQIAIYLIMMNYSNVGGDLRIVTNGTEDRIGIAHLTIENNLSVNVGAFNDSVELYGCHVFGSTTLIGGSGTDTVTLNFNSFDGGLDVQKFELP